MTNDTYIKTQENVGFAAKVEMLIENGVRTLNRTTKADGSVMVTAQNSSGPWLRDENEWVSRTRNIRSI
jgi:hypothetical protein